MNPNSSTGCPVSQSHVTLQGYGAIPRRRRVNERVVWPVRHPRWICVSPYALSMTDEPADAGQESRPPDGERTDERRFRVLDIVDLETSDGPDFGGPTPGAAGACDFEMVAFATAAAIYSKAFMETLAKHHAEWLIKAVHDRFRKNGKATELVVGPENDAAATLVITEDLPYAARLALLDLDVTAPELRGRELRWDTASGAWRPSEALPAEPGAASGD